MGLDTTHDAWHGGYGTFTQWRIAVGTAAGYGPGMAGRIPYLDLDWDSFPPQAHMGDWADVTPADPLLYLLVHSDCDGAIPPEQAGPLADRLEEIAPLLTDDEIGYGYARWRSRTLTFVAGLRRALEAGEVVEFQ